MNARKVKEIAEKLKRQPIEEIAAMYWINEALDVLSTLYDSANVQESTTIEVNDVDTEYSLPSNHRGIKRVKFNNEEYKDYFAQIDFIKFRDIGTFTVYVLKKASDISIITDTPAISELYHSIIPLFVASRELTEVDPSNPYIMQLQNEFYARASSINDRLKDVKRGSNYIPARPWR